MTNTPAPWTPTPDCCAVWPQLWHLFNWMSPQGHDDVVLMPYAQAPNDATKWRINHCPSCGADVRNCVVDRARLADVLF